MDREDLEYIRQGKLGIEDEESLEEFVTNKKEVRKNFFNKQMSYYKQMGDMQKDLATKSTQDHEDDFDSVVDFCNSLKFPLKVYRGLLWKDKDEVRLDNLGVHWTIDKDFINRNNFKTILVGEVNEDDVDWKLTQHTYIYYSVNKEHKENEIWLKKNAKPHNLEVYSQEEFKSLDEKIVKKGNKWQVQSEKGRNLGTYDTKQEAEKRLKQVHYFKHVNESKQDIEKFRQWAGDELANRFFNVKNRLEGKYRDIYYYMGLEKDTFERLIKFDRWKDDQERAREYAHKVAIESLTNAIEYLERTPTRKEVDAKGKEGAEKVYEDDRWLVLKINTYEASVKYGKHTQWCITGTNSQADGGRADWENHEHNDMYFYIDKKNNHKYALEYADWADWVLYSEEDYVEVGKGIPFRDAIDALGYPWNPNEHTSYPAFPKVEGLPDLQQAYRDAIKYDHESDLDVNDFKDESLKESYESKTFELGTAGFIKEDGTFIYADILNNYMHGGVSMDILNQEYPEFSNTHPEEDTCIRIFKKPNEIQYQKIIEIIDKYLDREEYCKVELWDNGEPYFYQVYSLYEGACDEYYNDIENVGNWTGYKLVQIIKNYYKSLNEDLLNTLKSNLKDCKYNLRTKGWHDKYGKTIRIMDDDWEPDMLDWYYSNDTHIFENDGARLECWIDEKDKVFTISILWKKNDSKGEATKLFRKALGLVPKDWKIQINNNVNKGYWKHVFDKYFPDRNYENTYEALKEELEEKVLYNFPRQLKENEILLYHQTSEEKLKEILSSGFIKADVWSQEHIDSWRYGDYAIAFAIDKDKVHRANDTDRIVYMNVHKEDFVSILGMTTRTKTGKEHFRKEFNL